MKKIFYLTLLTMIAMAASAQTIVVNYTPGTLGACNNRDTVSVTVTNSTVATVTNLRLEPTLNGFNFVSMVPVAGVSVTNPSNLTPQMTIASLAPAATVRIRYFVQAGCNSTSTSIANVLKNSSGVVLNTATTGVINVLFPSITMVGTTNTSAANQTSPGLLTNLVTEQVIVRTFTINSTNNLVPLTQAKAVVLNQFRYYQFIGINRGLFSQTSQGDTFTYTFRGSDFQTVGDGDTLLEVGENFVFSDTMRIKGCNTSVPSNLGLIYYATWGCFTSGAAFCDKSSDVNALGEAKVVPYALTVIRAQTDNGTISNSATNNFSYCKPFTMLSTYRNTTNNGGIPGSGNIYDLDILSSSSDWPFGSSNNLVGFFKNTDGTFQFEIDSIHINGVKVTIKDTFSSAPGTIFNTDTFTRSKVRKVAKLTPATYTSPISTGLKDLDGDGEIDDLAEGDSVQIRVFYRMNPDKFTSLVNSRTWEAVDGAVAFNYQTPMNNIYYRNMCKEGVLPRSQHNFLYNYNDFDQFEVGGTEDFYGGGAVHPLYVKYWNQYSLPNAYVDTQKIIIKTILPPGLNYVPNSVGKMTTQLPTISGNANPGNHWLNAAQQYEVDGPGDYDTVVFVFNNSTSPNNALYTLPFNVTLDCASLADPCLDLYPSLTLVQDSIKSFFYLQEVSAGVLCYDQLLMKDASPIRKHCPASKKGYNLTAFEAKRETIGFLPDYRRVKITPSHPYIDSIDYSQTIPYDTVKYTIRGYVKDTAFNTGIAYAHFKNLYDNLDTIRVLPSSTIRIFDVSSATTYNFFVTNALYVRPVSGRGDIEINLGAFVDSIRATGNTTFMMGGQTGSTVYTPDSFVIEFYGVLTHNTQKEPYTNTQRDISPIGELKSEVAQVNQDCELWGRALRVVQLYHGIPNFDYTPQAASIGACDLNGSSLIRWYYWQSPTPDYFPYETRFSNRLMDTVSMAYNPVYIDSVLGPWASTYAFFNRNPTSSASVADSTTFSRSVSFGATHLPQNQRLIERYTNRIVYRIDSMYPKLTPTYTSDDYHHYDIGFYFRPTCALPLTIPYQTNYNTAGSFMPNLVRISGIYWHNRQMPRIFDSILLPGGTQNAWASYAAAAPNPTHSLNVNPSSANIAQKDTLEWTVTVGNTSTTAMPRTWLDFRAKSATIVRVVDLVSGLDMPLLTYAVGANQYKWSQVGNVPASGSRQFRIFAKVNGCIDDTITLREGFNCSYYPTDPDAGYLPPFNYKCAARENVALLPIQIPPGQIQVVMTSITPGTGVINVCDTITIEYRITNLGAADLRKVNFAYTIPVTSNLTYVANSANYKWPATASYQALPVVPTITGSTYNFDMTGYFKAGVLPNQTATGDSNSVVVRMKYVTGCPFRSGDQVFMNTTGERACGDVIEGNGFATLQLRVNGLPTNPSLTMEVNPFTVSDFGMCNDTGRIEMLVRHTSGSTTNGTQYIQYEMPQNFVLTPGTVTVTNPGKFISTTPTVTTTGGKTILEWRFASNFAVNDTARIRFGITSTSQRLTCANNLFTKTTVLEKYPVSAACASGGNCNVDFPIFTKEDTSAIQGGIISISNLAVTSSLINSPLGETVNYSYMVTNTGKATSNLKFKFMGGAFMTDSVHTHTVASLASGASTTVTGSYFAPAGKACALRVSLDSSVNCVCSYPTATVGFGVTAAKNDTTICSGTTLSVGMNPVSGYTYLWGDGNTTSNPSYTYTNTDPDNMDTVRNTLFITRMGCNSFDTIVVAIKPIPQGLDITADNTCLLTNPITFTASSTSSGVTYNWTFPGGGTSTTNPTDRTMTAGVQNVIINATKNGCSATYNESFTFFDLNNSATADNPTICFNTSTLLRANSSNATNFQWYRVNRTTGARLATMGTAPTQSTGNITDTTRYRVVVTNGTCTDSSDVTVSVISNVVVGRVDTTICPGQNVILSVPFTFNTANWTNLQSGFTNSGLTWSVNPTVTTMYRVVAETASPVCTATDTVYVTVRAVTLPVVSGSRALCSGGSSTTYTASPSGTSISWSASAGSITSGGVYTPPTVSSATNVVLTYMHTDVNGCIVSDTHNIVINPLPTVSITSSNASMCATQTRALTATPAGGTFSGTGVSGSTFTAPTTPGSYTITYTFTDGNGCVGTTTQSITVNPRVGLTAVSFSPTVVCVGSTTTASSSPSSGSWAVVSGPGTINSGTGVLSTSATSLITVRYTHPGISGSSCPDTVQGTITPVARPTATPTATPTTICNGASTTIAAGAAGGTSPYTYAWNIGTGASHSQSPTSNTAYNVTVTDNNSCTATGTVNVTVTGSTPLAADAGSARAICNGASTSLGGSPTGTGGAGGYTYAWSSTPAGFSSTAANPTATPTATTTYTVTVTSSGCTVSSSVVVTVNSRPSVAPSASPSAICNGQSSTIAANATGGTAPLTYNWNIGSGASHSQSPTATTAYNVTVTDNNSCTTSGTVTVNVTGTTPLAADAGTARAICNGASTTLGGAPTGTGGAGGYTYAWSSTPAGFSSTAANPSATPTATTTYTVTVTSSGCTVSSSVVVTVNPRPTMAPTATPPSICNGQSSTIAANGSGGTGTLTYTWNIGSGASHVQSPSSTTAYNPTVTDANGCTASGSVTLNVVGISPLIANAGSARTICSGVSTNLGGSPTAIGGSGGYTYAWSSTPAGFSSTAANPSASPTTTTTYTVTVTSSGCTATNTVVVTVNPSPSAAPSASLTTICNGQSVTINANATGGTAPLGYTWNIGSGASHVHSPTANTTYLVTVTDANGCTASGSVTVNVTGSTPLAADAGSARTICNGVTTSLGGTPTGTGGAGGYTYAWSSTPAGFSSTIANPTATPSATTTYTVTVTSSGCTATSSVVVTVNPRPSVSPSASPSSLCNGQSTTISANATGGTSGYTYSWSGGSGASFTATPSSTTSYSVTVTDANGCTTSGSVTVNVTGTSPLVAVAGSARAICNGSSTTVGGSPTASGGAGSYTYAWSGGLGVTANPVASPSSTIWYRLTVTSSGCTAVDSVLVTVNPRPNVAPSASITNLCFGGSSTVSANASGGTGTINYVWSPSGAGASFVATPNATTIYNVTATDANGCTATGNASVNVIGSSPLTANAGTNRTICNGSSTTLGASPTGTGGNTSGTYTYSWSSNPAGFSSTAGNPTVSPSATTTYTVTVTNSTCTATNSVIVSVNPRPSAAPSASVNPVCSGANTTIAANASGGTAGYTYQWNTSQTSGSFVATPTTTVAVVNAYTVTVTDVNNCTISATVNVNVTPLPVMTPIANQSVCIPASGGSVSLNAAAMTVGQTGAWSTITSPTGTVSFTSATSASTNVSTLTPINTYTFRWTLTENGCSNWTNTNVTVNESPVIEAGMNDTICNGNSKTLSASLTSVSPAAINWKANAITATPFAFTTSTTVSPVVTTKYIFTAAITPCIVSDTVVVGVINKPDLMDDMTACQSATEDVQATIPLVNLTSNDDNTPVIRGGMSYAIGKVKHGTASILGSNVLYKGDTNYYGQDTVQLIGFSTECNWLRDTAIFCVSVAGVNDKPTVNPDTVRVVGTNPKTFNPLANDSDVETALGGMHITVLSGPNNGSVTGPASDGTMTYTASNPNLATLDTIVYEVCDTGLPMPSQCNINRIVVMLIPEIKDSTTKTTPGSPVTLGPVVTRGPGVTLNPKLEGSNGSSGTTITTPSGTATINPTTGVMTFTPNDTPFIGKDTIRKILCFTYPNGIEICDTSIVVISNPNVTNTSSNTTPMNTPKVVGTLQPYKFEGGVATTTPTPNATVDPVTGAVTYTPKPGFVGIDTVKITRCDSKGNCVTDIMVVTVAPNLKDTTVRVPQGLPVTLKMPITRYPGQSLTSTVLTNTKNGTATVAPDGSVTYQSNPNFTGRDTLVRRICVYDSTNMQTFCDTITEIFDVFPHKTNPDIAVGNMGETISGNVSTNDQVLPGTTYGSPVASSSNPSSGVPTMNPDGTYSFNTIIPGTYVFTIPVCPPGYTTGCPTETLTITVVDPSRKDNKPIVNADRAITKPSTAVKVDVLANDATGNIGIPLNRSSLAVATSPKNGTAVVNADGTITYTPNAGFIGRDTFYYTICDQATPPNCGTGMAVVNVTNEDLADVRDDVAKGNGTLTGNVLSNDKFPAGSSPSVKPIDTVIAGKGRLVIDANGNYTWTPVNGFNGSMQVPVTVCDGKTPQTCYTSTLHIVSTISADVVIPNYFSPNGDGTNDVWSLDDLLDRYPNARAVIYNRWGNIVWRSTGPYGRSTSGRNLWHGQLEGSQDLVPDGVYYYLIELEDEFKTTKTGFIEIMRQ